MRRNLTILAILLVAAIGGLGLWGVTLPREHHASSRVTIAAPPETVYNVMRDQAGIPSWWSEVDRIEAVSGTDGWERWREKMGAAEFTLIIAEEEPGERFITRIDSTDGGDFGGTWTHETALTTGGATTVTITENGWVGNPFFRVAMKLSGPNTTLDSYLTALGTRFGQHVTRVHVLP